MADLKTRIKQLFGGKPKVVSAKKVLNNKVVMRNPYGGTGAKTHQRIAEAELAAQSRAAQKKTK